MGRSSRCADCGVTVVVTSARPQFRDGSMVLVCQTCAGVPASNPEPPGDDYDEMVVDVDDAYDDVEVSVEAGDGNVFHGQGDASVSGAVDVDERAPRQRDPTLPPVVIDKAR